MADEFDLKIAELEHKTAQVNKETAQVSANSGRTNNLLQYVVGGVLTAGLAGLFSYLASLNNFNSAIRETELKYQKENRELDLELARLSLAILAGDYEKDVENSLPARMFALNALERGTGVEIPEDDKWTWAETGTIPGNIDWYGGSSSAGTSGNTSGGGGGSSSGGGGNSNSRPSATSGGGIADSGAFPEVSPPNVVADQECVLFLNQYVCGQAGRQIEENETRLACVESELGSVCGPVLVIDETEQR